MPTTEQIAKLSEQRQPPPRGSATEASGRGPRSSRFTGVCRGKSTRWLVAIKAHGTTRHLGAFDDEEDAARVYDRAAFFLRGRWVALTALTALTAQGDGCIRAFQGRHAQLPGGRPPVHADG